MKVKAKSRKKFEPIDLTFTIESKEELKMFEELAILNETIPSCLDDENMVNCTKFLKSLYQQLFDNQGLNKYK